jgi:hypothetical protein
MNKFLPSHYDSSETETFAEPIAATFSPGLTLNISG